MLNHPFDVREGELISKIISSHPIVDEYHPCTHMNKPKSIHQKELNMFITVLSMEPIKVYYYIFFPLRLLIIP